jgi:hypothetical protein
MHLLRLRLCHLDRHGRRFIEVRDHIVKLKNFSGTLSSFCVVFNVYKSVFGKQFDMFLTNGVVCLAVGAPFYDAEVKIRPEGLERLDFSLRFDKIVVGAFVTRGSLLVLCDECEEDFCPR